MKIFILIWMMCGLVITLSSQVNSEEAQKSPAPQKEMKKAVQTETSSKPAVEANKESMKASKQSVEQALEKNSADVQKANQELAPVKKGKGFVFEAEPKKEMESVETVKEEAPEPKKEESELANEVLPLKEMIVFYNKEIQTIEHMMERWDKKFNAESEGYKKLKAKIEETQTELDGLIQENDRKNRRKISGLKKYLRGLARDEKGYSKRIATLKKGLSRELKDYSKASRASKEVQLQKILLEIQAR